MLHIEIHGVELGYAIRLKKKIGKLFKGQPYYKNTPVTIFRETTDDLENKCHLVIRIYHDCQAPIEEILEKLYTLEEEEFNIQEEFDIQCVPCQYIPKKEKIKKDKK